MPDWRAVNIRNVLLGRISNSVTTARRYAWVARHRARRRVTINVARARAARFRLLRYSPGDRHGVLWASTMNIGDEIQTLAAIDLLRRCGIDRYTLIDRERLRAYSGPPLTLLMNGWFIHNPDYFLPPGHVRPIYIGFHCTPSLVERVIVRHAAHFRKHQPIGCRDDFTREALERVGVEAYLSGCPTLAFEPHERKDGGVYCIKTQHLQPPSQFEQSLVERSGMERLGAAHGDAEHVSHLLDRRLKGARKKGLLERAGMERLGAARGEVEHISHLLDPRLQHQPERRLDEARKLLDLYRSAKLIITSRLHVALPARAFHTDVAFLHRRYHSDARFKGLHDVLNGSATGPLSPEQVKTDRAVVARYREGLLKRLKQALG